MQNSENIKIENSSDVRFGRDYESYFEPGIYLKTYYTGYKLETDDYYTTNLNHWHDVFVNNGIQHGGTLLDLGCGPNISNVISGSKICPQIVLSELAGVNRDAIVKWINKEPDAHDWTAFFQYVANREGSDAQTIENRLRKAIIDVIPCDVLEKQPLLEKCYDPFDVVISSCCLENACPNNDSFKVVAENIYNLLKPSGHFVMVGDLNKNYYMVGKEKFFSLPLNRELVESTFRGVGFSIKSFQSHVTSGKYSDANGYFFMSAQKL